MYIVTCGKKQHLFLNEVVQVLICHKLAYTTGCKAKIILRDGIIS